MRLNEIFKEENKYTFSKDTIPFYPSILSLGAYNGHLVGESASSKHVITKQYTDIQKEYKMPVNKMTDMATSFTHKIKIGDVVHTAKIEQETDDEIILKNIDGTVSKISINKNGDNFLQEEKKEDITKYAKKTFHL